jgi:hypothetical protein
MKKRTISLTQIKGRREEEKVLTTKKLFLGLQSELHELPF